MRYGWNIDPVTGVCEYDITILHEDEEGKLFVCGTDGICPPRETLCSCETSPAEGIAPFSLNERAPSLYIERELYSTANLYAHGDGVGIRRHYSARGPIWSDANKTEQIYVGMTLSGPRADRLQDRIYTFLVERNLDQYPDADLWVSRVTQVCKVDRGGPKAILQNQWTSLLSAQLSCGFPERKLGFKHLLDVSILQADSWRDSRVYALFTNGWGMSAVCIYTMGDIDDVFTKSSIKGNTKPVRNSHPIKCVEDSRKLPPEVLRQRKDYQETKDWVRPVNGSDPFMVSHHHYRHIRADRVSGKGLRQHTVLLLSLESGAVHKVMEQNGQAFIIAELHPFSHRTHIQNMLLQPSTKRLYVSTNSEVVELDLQSCQGYGQQCEDCVLARDPYCGWDGSQCTAASGHTIQDVEHGNYLACQEAGKTAKIVVSHEVHRVPLSARFFLQCPMLSSHAQYRWHHQEHQRECLPAEGQCLLLIEEMSPELEGNYSCVASERGYVWTLIQYELQTEMDTGQLGPSSQYELKTESKSGQLASFSIALLFLVLLTLIN
ncbi:semaphorin-7A-like [Megalops cyprinoides]|uniref:semaphorin-7A-like n=1 Tax=Megalops cyprinoides TaxID=118141 RepID=UPI0018644662|nr:semaphorin-7A-like [Megalops cyprinoides]